MTTMNIKAKIATVAAALVLFTNTIAAANNNPLTADVKLISNSAEPTFLVNVSNKESEKLTLLVKNAEGEVLYKETISSVNYTKRFRFLVYDVSEVKLTFVISDSKGNSTAFEANNEVRTTESFVVNKL
jgi:hypothetical protein